MTSADAVEKAVPNDGKFIAYDAACERFGLSRKKLRALVRQYGLTTFKPVAFDRRYHLRIDALEAIPSLADRADRRPDELARCRRRAVDEMAGGMPGVHDPGHLDRLPAGRDGEGGRDDD